MAETNKFIHASSSIASHQPRPAGLVHTCGSSGRASLRPAYGTRARVDRLDVIAGRQEATTLLVSHGNISDKAHDVGCFPVLLLGGERMADLPVAFYQRVHAALQSKSSRPTSNSSAASSFLSRPRQTMTRVPSTRCADPVSANPSYSEFRRLRRSRG